MSSAHLIYTSCIFAIEHMRRPVVVLGLITAHILCRIISTECHLSVVLQLKISDSAFQNRLTRFAGVAHYWPIGPQAIVQLMQLLRLPIVKGRKERLVNLFTRPDPCRSNPIRFLVFRHLSQRCFYFCFIPTYNLLITNSPYHSTGGKKIDPALRQTCPSASHQSRSATDLPVHTKKALQQMSSSTFDSLISIFDQSPLSSTLSIDFHLGLNK